MYLITYLCRPFRAFITMQHIVAWQTVVAMYAYVRTAMYTYVLEDLCMYLGTYYKSLPHVMSSSFNDLRIKLCS